jgi:hypothetical protein
MSSFIPIAHNKNNYHSELEKLASNPTLQKFAEEHLQRYGSLAGIYSAAYGGSSFSNSGSRSYSGSDNSPTAGSSGKYMVHCYYGSQSDNKITTVIG